jgi:protein pelota
VLANKKNFVVVHSSSGHLHSLSEVLKSPEVLAKLDNAKYAKETRFMDNFMTMLRKDDGRAWYGPSEVEKAVEKGAVGQGGGVLLINNSLFRSQEIGVRKRWVALVDKVKEEGGDARVLSSDHESGKRLEGLGGIAAILTFPLDDLDEGEEKEDVSNDIIGEPAI